MTIHNDEYSSKRGSIGGGGYLGMKTFWKGPSVDRDTALLYVSMGDIVMFAEK